MSAAGMTTSRNLVANSVKWGGLKRRREPAEMDEGEEADLSKPAKVAKTKQVVVKTRQVVVQLEMRLALANRGITDFVGIDCSIIRCLTCV